MLVQVSLQVMQRLQKILKDFGMLYNILLMHTKEGGKMCLRCTGKQFEYFFIVEN